MRYFSKKALAAAALLLVFFAPRSVVFGQSGGHFEWAKGFGTGSPESGRCRITGSVTDSLGNLYILGRFRNDSEWGTGWDAERLLPMAPYGPGPNNTNILIAKISPDGEMVWKKVIHSNNGAGNYPKDIKKVGDTAFACLVEMFLPTEDHYTYYLDTLIRGRSDYPIASMYVENPMRTAFIMFDFEGNVLEQHFLYLTYTDTTGNDIVNFYNYNIDTTPWFRSNIYMNSSFDIDGNGNIYISRVSGDILDDSFNAQDGSIRGVKFWVDGRQVGKYFNVSKPRFWYPQIIKFSPHFDTLLAYRYIVQSNSNDVSYSPVHNTSTLVDKNGNIFFSNTLIKNGYQYDTITIDSIYGFSFDTPDRSQIIAYLVNLDSALNTQCIITLKDSVINMSNSPSMTIFHDLYIDNDSNLLFVSASTSRGTVMDTLNFYSILTLHDIPLSLKNNTFVMSFKKNNNTLEMYSYCVVPSIFQSNAESLVHGNLFSKNNRIFIQSQYVGGVRLPFGNVRFSNHGDWGMGLIVFDYQGNLIGGYDYNALSPNNDPGPIALHDSAIYISGELYSDATFGDITFGLNGFSQTTYIAKLIDTSFTTPYVGPTNSNITTKKYDRLFIFPNPAFDIINLNFESEPIIEVSAISITGRKTPLLFNESYIGVSELQQGLYILEIVTIKDKYHSKFIKL